MACLETGKSGMELLGLDPLRTPPRGPARDSQGFAHTNHRLTCVDRVRRSALAGWRGDPELLFTLPAYRMSTLNATCRGGAALSLRTRFASAPPPPAVATLHPGTRTHALRASHTLT